MNQPENLILDARLVPNLATAIDNWLGARDRQLYREKSTGALASYSIIEETGTGQWRRMNEGEIADNELIQNGWKVLSAQNFRGQGAGKPEEQRFWFEGQEFDCGEAHHWKTNPAGRGRLISSGRLLALGKTVNYKRSIQDYGDSRRGIFIRKVARMRDRSQV